MYVCLLYKTVMEQEESYNKDNFALDEPLEDWIVKNCTI